MAIADPSNVLVPVSPGAPVVPACTEDLFDLYEEDEAAWLDAMAELIAQRRLGELDLVHLAEFLSDMSRSERRETRSRLVVLLTHLLKWTHPERRSGSWRGTIRHQTIELRLLAESGVLRKHAEQVFDDAYQDARRIVADEMETEIAALPEKAPWNLQRVLEGELF